MRIALLGATGQIGSRILEQVRDDYSNSTIIACSRTSKPGYFLFDPYKDNWTVLGQVDVLINCIGIINETKAFGFKEAHVDLSQLIATHRNVIGSPRIIQISANGASPSSQHPYFKSKGEADQIITQLPNTYIVKPSVVCSHRCPMVKQLLNTRKLSILFFNTLPFPKSNFSVRLQPVLDSDLSELISELCTIEKADQTIIAVGNDIFTVRQLFRYLNRYLIVIPVSKGLFDKMFRLLKPFLKKVITETQYQLLSQDNTGNPEPMEKVLGRKVRGTVSFWKREFSF